MSKGKRKHKRKGAGGHGPAAPSPEAILTELETTVGEIAADPDGAGPRWGAVHKLLVKAGTDVGEVARLIATRDVEGLQKAIRTLRGEESPPEVEPAADAGAEAGAEAGPSPPEEIPVDTLKAAMRAFRKRLKLMRLDHESKLGVGPMTGGKQADFDAIIPPHDYEREVWDALCARGQLRAMGQGFYMLAEESEAAERRLAD